MKQPSLFILALGVAFACAAGIFAQQQPAAPADIAVKKQQFEAIFSSVEKAKREASQAGDWFMTSEFISSGLAFALMRLKEEVPEAAWREKLGAGFDLIQLSALRNGSATENYATETSVNAVGLLNIRSVGKDKKDVFLARTLGKSQSLVVVPGIIGTWAARAYGSDSAIDPNLIGKFERLITQRVGLSRSQLALNPSFQANLLSYMRSQFVLTMALPKFQDGADKDGRYLEKQFDDLLAIFDEAIFMGNLNETSTAPVSSAATVERILNARNKLNRGDGLRVWTHSEKAFQALGQGCYVRDYPKDRSRFQIVHRDQLAGGDDDFEWVDEHLVFPLDCSIGDALLCMKVPLPSNANHAIYAEMLSKAEN